MLAKDKRGEYVQGHCRGCGKTKFRPGDYCQDCFRTNGSFRREADVGPPSCDREARIQRCQERAAQKRELFTL